MKILDLSAKITRVIEKNPTLIFEVRKSSNSDKLDSWTFSRSRIRESDSLAMGGVFNAGSNVVTAPVKTK